jgi:hypothetical protein
MGPQVSVLDHVAMSEDVIVLFLTHSSCSAEPIDVRLGAVVAGMRAPW